MKTATKKASVKYDETNFPSKEGMMISRTWTDKETKEVAEFVAMHKVAAKQKTSKVYLQNIL